MKQRVQVSPEMLAFIGSGSVDPEWASDWLVLVFTGLDGVGPALATVASDADRADFAEAAVVFAIDPAACLRLFDFLPDEGVAWHLPSELRAMALAIRDCPLREPARSTLRLAKSIELLCAFLAQLADGTMVPADTRGALSEGDAVRILAASRIIEERWREKLTLDAIARACGLNRTKLTRGFRLMFDRSVADALAENRLGGARRMLRETDLPVSSIGYACGYQNNASFTRAFSRRFGMAPSQLRQLGGHL